MNAQQKNSVETKQCPMCAETIKSQAIVCKHCHANLFSTEPSFATRPNPKGAIAGVLSFFIVGLGQIYNGRIAIGLSALVLSFVSVSLAVALFKDSQNNGESSEFLMSIALVLLIFVPVYLTGIWDAHKNASGRNRPFVIAIRSGCFCLVGAFLIAFAIGWSKAREAEIANAPADSRGAIYPPLTDSELKQSQTSQSEATEPAKEENYEDLLLPPKTNEGAQYSGSYSADSFAPMPKVASVSMPSEPADAAALEGTLYKDDDVQISCTFDDGSNLSDQTVINVDTTNKSTSKIIKFWPNGLMINVLDNYGNRYWTDSAKFVDGVDPSSNHGLYPGDACKFRLVINQRILPTAKSLNVHIPRDEFGNSKKYQISMPLKSAAASTSSSAQ